MTKHIRALICSIMVTAGEDGDSSKTASTLHYISTRNLVFAASTHVFSCRKWALQWAVKWLQIMCALYIGLFGKSVCAKLNEFLLYQNPSLQTFVYWSVWKSVCAKLNKFLLYQNPFLQTFCWWHFSDYGVYFWWTEVFSKILKLLQWSTIHIGISCWAH